MKINKKNAKSSRKYLRNNLTSAEAQLWKLLKNKKLMGRKFRRQTGFDNYVVDFYCPGEKLIVELDGEPHSWPGQISKDERRDQFFKDMGYRVIRFENYMVFRYPEQVLNEIADMFYKE